MPPIPSPPPPENKPNRVDISGVIWKFACGLGCCGIRAQVQIRGLLIFMQMVEGQGLGQPSHKEVGLELLANFLV